MNRRKLITGLATLFAAPAIVRASSLMAISPLPPITLEAAGWGPIQTVQWSIIAHYHPDTGVVTFASDSAPP